MKHKIIKKTLLTIGISLSIVNSHLSIAQRSLGVSGLLNIPSADMQEDGTFMAGGNYLPQEMLPQEWGYNSGNYFVNLTFLPFMEVAYRCTLLKVESTGKWNQDRSVSLRLRPLKEGKWWPSVVIGSNDLLTTGELNPFEDSGGNRYFSSVYAVGTKHFGFYGHDIGVTVGGHVPFRSRSENKGVFGGVSYRPAFLKPLEVMAEYDSKAVNMGVSARLFIHAGPVPPNPAELLLGDRLETLIAELRKRYDYIILDNVPAGVVADAVIVNRVADLTIYVVRAGRMDRRALPEVEKLYQEGKLRNMSLILNGTVYKHGAYGYRYGYGYGYSYGYGYGYGQHKNK